MNPLKHLNEMGQSVWLDFIRRDLMDSGELAERVASGEVRGITSNPSIFAQAIAGSDLYTSDLRMMSQAGWKVERIFDALSIDDIRAAAGVLLPLYEKTNGEDGFVSIEVNPQLARDTRATLREASRLWEVVNRPNVMIKIPATQAGIPAIEQAIAQGINVNITLIFSLERYADVMEAYIRGLEKRRQKGESLNHVASVASFFVSRIDTAVDKILTEIIRNEEPNSERAAALLGKAAIASAKLAYAQFKATFSDARFEAVAQHGGRVQRPLWASTSTKNPEYPNTYYVDNLIGPDTVNTIPPSTLEAFQDHGTVEATLEQDLSVARAQLEALNSIDISMEEVTLQLEEEGVAKFADAHRSLMKTLHSRSRALQKEVAILRPDLVEILEQVEEKDVGQRLWAGDSSLWTHQSGAAREIEQRLGWLNLPQTMGSKLDDLSSFATEVMDDGLTKVVWMGMGGSSLAADVIHKTLTSTSGLEFIILDSTDPAHVNRITRKAPASESLSIVASKSGTTSEVSAFEAFFLGRANRQVKGRVSDLFAAVTDAGSPLAKSAGEQEYRRVFSPAVDVGGRYSALSEYGLLPAVLIGADSRAILDGGRKMAAACGPGSEPARNPGIFLGSLLGAAVNQGRNKLTLIADPELEALVAWIEQLVAESSGKEGKGLLPIVGEPPGSAKVYDDERILVYLRSSGKYDRRLRGWVSAKLPTIVLETGSDAQALGEAFFLWEVATVVVCHLIEVNPFDQPDVQRAKSRTKELIRVYRKRGALPQPKEKWRGDGIQFFSDDRGVIGPDAQSLKGLLVDFLKALDSSKHLALLLYLPQWRVSKQRMARIRRMVRDKLGIASTLGFGPRYLHSTGQFHKGGSNSSTYLIVTAEPKKDLDIPNQDISFGTLQRAQAIGDYQALKGLGRAVHLLHLDTPGRFREVTETILSAIQAM
jgi:transaldolase/glucose-6-phosphate isomerase